jgi:hypothetical protein
VRESKNNKANVSVKNVSAYNTIKSSKLFDSNSNFTAWRAIIHEMGLIIQGKETYTAVVAVMGLHTGHTMYNVGCNTFIIKLLK